MPDLLVLLCVLSGIPGGIGITAGTSISSLSPIEQQYDDRFRTPGFSYGIVASLDAPGFLVFHLGGEYFMKKASSGWDGELSSVLLFAFPCAQLGLMEGFSMFAGPGIVGVRGSYSGTDDFGSYVEEDGSSIGFAASMGADIVLSGPVSARLEYRRGWMDMKSDRVLKDGIETAIYPSVETDLGFSQYSFSLNVQLSSIDAEGL
jgi:opacity protein-like surface antigen